MRARFACLLFAACCLLIGCGKDKSVVIGDPGKAGEFKRDIDTAKEVGAKATDYQKSGEKDIYGG